MLVPALALFALALPARADSPSLFGLTVNGDDIAYASGTGWTFDGATVSLAGPGPDKGKRAETLVACHLLKAVEGWTDLGYGEFSLDREMPMLRNSLFVRQRKAGCPQSRAIGIVRWQMNTTTITVGCVQMHAQIMV